MKSDLSIGFRWRAVSENDHKIRERSPSGLPSPTWWVFFMLEGFPADGRMSRRWKEKESVSRASFGTDGSRAFVPDAVARDDKTGYPTTGSTVRNFVPRGVNGRRPVSLHMIGLTLLGIGL